MERHKPGPKPKPKPEPVETVNETVVEAPPKEEHIATTYRNDFGQVSVDCSCGWFGSEYDHARHLLK